MVNILGVVIQQVALNLNLYFALSRFKESIFEVSVIPALFVAVSITELSVIAESGSLLLFRSELQAVNPILRIKRIAGIWSFILFIFKFKM